MTARRAGRLPRWSGFAQQGVNHPAASDILAPGPAVAEDVGVVASGFFEGVGEDRELIERSLLVNPPGDFKAHAAASCSPGGTEQDRMQGAAHDVADQCRLPHRRKARLGQKYQQTGQQGGIGT